MVSKKQWLKTISGDWSAAEISIYYKKGVLLKTPVSSTTHARKLVAAVWDEQLINLQEQFMAFYLDSKRNLLGYRLINTGLSDEVNINIKLIVCLALHTMATSVIVAHNHPSGSTEPSDEDIDATMKIRRALRLISVKLTDHIIISERETYSFEDGFGIKRVKK